jgi:hypothetical protein
MTDGALVKLNIARAPAPMTDPLMAGAGATGAATVRP